ncbi:TolC family protein [Maridesulfovibrio sp.]|uniref:TolC family protein n=1 Tax=Maridesulfovibrio sp. TaxID=2795000 RepID=UPI0029CA0C04|nr:TolC family protein [Maridesulfovibrio sp.]
MKHKRKILLLAFALTFLMHVSAGTGFAQDDQDSLLDSLFQSKTDDTLVSLIKEATSKKAEGGQGLMFGKDVTVLSYEEIPRTVLESNPNIEMSEINIKMSESKKDEADAYFYPTFDFMFNYYQYDTYNRSEEIGRLRQVEIDFDEFEASFVRMQTGEAEVSSLQCLPRVYDSTTDTWLYEGDCADQTAYSVRTEFASGSASYPTYPEQLSGSVGIAQPLEWGQYLNLGFLVEYQNVRYPSLGEWSALYSAPTGVDFPLGHNPWASTLSGGFTTALPYTKDFGKDGFRPTVAAKLAQIGSKQQQFNRKNAINSLISGSQIAYWDLVKSIKKLQIIHNQLVVMNDIVERTKRLYLDGMRTTYDMVQAESNFAQLQDRKEIAWSEMVVASNHLSELLGREPDEFLFPVNYIPRLKDRFEVDEKASLAEANENRPDLKLAQINLESSSIEERYSQNQILPDLKFFVNFSLAQENNVYGYSTFGESIGHLGDPDSVNCFVGFSYSLPWGNKALEASYAQAKARKRQDAMKVELTKNKMVEEINLVSSQAMSSKRLIDMSALNLKLKQYAYDKAKQLRQDDQQISDFEFLEKFNDLLDAKLSYLNALVEHRKAYVQHQASIGTLSEIYAPETGEDK